MTMIKKIARAKYENGIGMMIPWDEAPAAVRAAYLLDARAAMKAIAEPTEAMVWAGQAAFQEGHAPDEIYRRMIAKGMDE